MVLEVLGVLEILSTGAVVIAAPLKVVDGSPSRVLAIGPVQPSV